MEAGDGALTQDRCPAPSRDANRSPAVPPRWSQRIVLFEAGTRPASTAGPEYEAGLRARLDHWHQAATRQPRAIRLLPARPAVAQGIVARMGGDCLSGSRRHDQSPVPALPGCAKSFFWRLILSRTQRSAQRCAPTAETDTATLQWFSLGTQALSARHQPDQMRPAATGLGLCRQGFGSLRQIGARKSAQNCRAFRTSH